MAAGPTTSTVTAMTIATSTRSRSRHETVTAFFGALAGPRDDGEFLELRYRLDDGQRMGQLFDRPSRVRGLATRALALGRRTDVYVGCAPRTRRHGGRNAVKRAFVLWVDCDGQDAVEALEHFDPQPAIVIASGTGSNCHAYWPLTQPLAADEIEQLRKRILFLERASTPGMRPEDAVNARPFDTVFRVGRLRGLL